MMYGKAKANAEAELVMVIIPSIFLLGLILAIGLRDWQVATATIGGVCLVIGAELGLLTLFNFEFSVLDGIALPIIMGVAVCPQFDKHLLSEFEGLIDVILLNWQRRLFKRLRSSPSSK